MKKQQAITLTNYRTKRGLETYLTPRAIFDGLDVSESTKEDYLSRLPSFLGFMRRHGVTRDILLHYKHYLRARTDLGVASKNKYLVVARLALRELHRHGAIPANISLGIKSFSQSNKHKVYGLTQDEVERLSKHLRSGDDSLKTLRLRAFTALLLFQGLRQIEICRLDVDDVDIPNQVIHVLGKGQDDKEPIHLHPETTKALTGYLKSYHVKHGALFTAANHTKSDRRLTTRGLRLIMQNLFKQVGISKTLHGTRHYFTTKLIEEYKSDLTTVARYTRHRNLETLQVYNDKVIQKKDLPRYYGAFREEIM
jgi:integrase